MYIHRRHSHLAGEVTCVCIEGYLSLPPGAGIGVRYYQSTQTGTYIIKCPYIYNKYKYEYVVV
jgi:hypothetical protein